MNSTIVLQLIANGLANGAVYVVLATGFSFVFLVHRFFYLAYGGVVLAAAYAFVEAQLVFQLGIFPAILFAAGAALIASIVYELVLHVPARKFLEPDDTLGPFLLSSVMLFITQNVALLFFGSYSYTLPIALPTFRLGDVALPSFHVVALSVLLPATVTATFIWSGTALGKELRALRDAPRLLQSTAVNTERLYLFSTLIAGLFGALAAIVLTFNQDVRYTMGAVVILKAIVAAIIAGDKGPWGVLFGGLLLGIFESFAGWVFPSGLVDACVGLLLIAILVSAPRGLLTTVTRQQ